MSVAARLLGLSGERAAIAARPQKASKPVVSTGNVGWSAPGSPMQSQWNADSAINVGYYGYVYAYRCARAIATTIAALPFRCGPNASNPTSFNLRSPLAQLLGPPPGTPAPSISSKQLLIHSIVSYLITGRFAWETPCPPGSTAPASLWPLIASRLNPIPSPDGSPTWFSSYQYNLNSTTKILSQQQVFYAWRPSQTDWRQPESVLQAAALPLSLGVALDKYMTAFMRNGMVSSTMVVTPEWEEPEMRRAFQDQFLAEMTGYDNAGRTSFAEYTDDQEGKEGPPSVQVIPLGTKPVDAEITALHLWVRDTICDAFGVPVSIVGQASERTYANSDQEHKNYWTGTILGLIEEILDHINMGLAPRLGNDVGWFDLSGVEALQPPPRFMQQMPDILVAANIVDVAEVREDLGLPPELPTGSPTQQTEPIPAVDDTPSTQGGSSTGAMRSLEMFADAYSGVRYDVSPIGLKPNWITKVGGLPLFARAVAHALIRNGHTESDAIQIAIGVIQDWAHGGGNVTAKTRAKAAATVAEWEAKKAAADGSRDGFVTEGSSDGAGSLLPKVGAPMTVKKGTRDKAIPPHLLVRGEDRGVCGYCGQKPNAQIHQAAMGKSRRVGMRHAGPVGHAHVRTGHYTGARRLTSRQVNGHADALEPAAESAMKTIFGQQRTATLSRLKGNRGKSMVRSAQTGDDSSPAPFVDASQVFDAAHWISKTQDALKPMYAAAAALSQERLAKFGTTTESQAAVLAALDARSATLAQTVSTTTLNQIEAALAQAVINGDSMGQMTAAVNQVFDNAESARAAMIARTEVIGALNTAADTHAAALGPSVIAGKEWIATHDDRTRPMHRAADSQIRAMGIPFLVGGFPMTCPGDPAAPPDEVINCRCTTGYLSPAEYASRSGLQLPTTSPIAA